MVHPMLRFLSLKMLSLKQLTFSVLFICWPWTTAGAISGNGFSSSQYDSSSHSASNTQGSTSLLIVPPSLVFADNSISTGQFGAEFKVASLTSALISLEDPEEEADQLLANRQFENPANRQLIRDYLTGKLERINELYQHKDDALRAEILDLNNEVNLIGAALITLNVPDRAIEIFDLKQGD